MAPRVVIHNHLRTRPIEGRFRATATTRDHAGEACDCGGDCCSGKSGLRDRYQRDASGYEKTNLGIDAKYSKGPMGNKIYETRHYVVEGFLVDPRGYGPQPAAVAGELRRVKEHGDMLRSGWNVEKVEGYYKQTKEHLSDHGRRKV
jgi:hypothetical protein